MAQFPVPTSDFFVYFSVVACNDLRIGETGPHIQRLYSQVVYCAWVVVSVAVFQTRNTASRI